MDRPGTRLFHLHYNAPDVARLEAELTAAGLSLHRRFGWVDDEFRSLEPDEPVPDGWRLHLQTMQAGYANVTLGQGTRFGFDHLGLYTGAFDAIVERARAAGWSVREPDGRRPFVMTPWGFRVELHPDGDDVEATLGSWTDGRIDAVHLAVPDESAVRGAEATVELGPSRVYKRRRPKAYRHPALDERLRRRRTREEVRLTSEARRAGVPTPVVSDVDLDSFAIAFETVGDADLREYVAGEAPDDDPARSATDDLALAAVADVGRHLATIHGAGFVHGDPTTRNVRVSRRDADATGRADEHEARSHRTYLIDFGLGYYSDDVEDYAMDLHVFAQSLTGTAGDPAPLLAAVEDAYREAGDHGVLNQLREIEGRGRYRPGLN